MRDVQEELQHEDWFIELANLPNQLVEKLDTAKVQ